MGLKWFGTDGVRGHVGHYPLTPSFVQKLGYFTGQVLGEASARPVIYVGRDTRQSGEMLQHALTSGLLASGFTVMDLGVCPTPGVSRLVKKMGANAGAVISASHNPVSENGIKFFNSSGYKLDEETEMGIEILLGGTADEWELPPLLGKRVEASGLKEIYLEDLLVEHFDDELQSVTVVMDCANGAACGLAEQAFSRLGARVIAVHSSPTGLNINDRAGSEHVRKNPSEMGELIRLFQADFGVAFDGDADRTVLVDEQGNLIDGDHMLGILAGYLDGQGMLAGRAVVTTHMRNQGLRNYTDSKGLVLHETKVGDKYVVRKLVECAGEGSQHGYALGGEQSGHVILLDDGHVTGDGIRTALFMARVFNRSGAESMCDMAGWMKKAPQVIASARVRTKPPLDGEPQYERVVQQAKKDLPGLLRIELRYSGTEPLFRAMLEADNRHSEQELADAAWKICDTVQTLTETLDRSVEILNCTRGGILKPSDHLTG